MGCRSMLHPTPGEFLPFLEAGWGLRVVVKHVPGRQRDAAGRSTTHLGRSLGGGAGLSLRRQVPQTRGLCVTGDVHLDPSAGGVNRFPPYTYSPFIINNHFVGVLSV